MLPLLVVFDMAGTTVYDGDAVHRCLDAALKVGSVEATRDEINAVMGIAKPLAIRTLLERHVGKAEEGEVERLHTLFLHNMKDYYANDPGVREIQGASEVFSALRANGVKVGLDTGFSRDIVDILLKRLDWEIGDLLDVTVTSDEVERGRPHPDMIYRAMDLLEIPRSEVGRVAKVGDTPSDLQEGTSAGCGWVIGVTEGSHSAEELASYPHTYLIPNVVHIHQLFLKLGLGSLR